ncbi:hypothetical protein [Labrys neptuniae]
MRALFILCGGSMGRSNPEATARLSALDCRVATLLAMTREPILKTSGITSRWTADLEISISESTAGASGNTSGVDF